MLDVVNHKTIVSICMQTARQKCLVCNLHHSAVQYLFNTFGFVSINIKLSQLPLLPGLFDAVPQLCKVYATLVIVVTQIIVPVGIDKKQPSDRSFSTAHVA